MSSDRSDAARIHRGGTQELREEWVTTVFDHNRDRHAWRHGHLNEVLDSVPIPAMNPSELEISPRELPAILHLPGTLATYLGVPPLTIERGQLLDLVGTRGLLVWHDGAIVHEEYRLGHDSTTPWMTNSASKVVIAMLVARAQMEGVIGPDETPITTYWPELSGTAWDGVTIGHCRQMTTGVGWDEEDLDLLDPESQWVVLFKELTRGSIDSYPGTVPRRDEPGEVVWYSSLDTEVLGGTLIRAANEGIAELVERWLWTPMRAESDAYWICDPTGREFALSGLNATLRDYTRLGILLLNHGRAFGQQLLPEAFCRKLEQPDPGLFSAPGADAYPVTVWEQAFVPNTLEAQDGDYMAAGSFNQIIYVSPRTRTVVAHHGITADITTEYIDMFRLFMAFREIGHSLL